MNTKQKIYKAYINSIRLGGANAYLRNHSLVEYLAQTDKTCFGVVDDITTYTETKYTNVYDKATNKWYKLNNLNQYEQYGVYEEVTSLDNTTTYVGKLVIYNEHEYKWTGSEWVDLGEYKYNVKYWLKGTTFAANVEHYWNNGYYGEIDVYVTGTYTTDLDGLDLKMFEINWYSNGFYLDLHAPTSTTEPTVYTGDYSRRIIKTSVSALSKTSVKQTYKFNSHNFYIYDYATKTLKYSATSGTYTYNWYTGLYPSWLHWPSLVYLSAVRIYDASGNLAHNFTIKKDDSKTTGFYMLDEITGTEYANTATSTPVYTEETGEKIIPEEYDEKVAPSDYVKYDTLEELELMECPYYGMIAIIGGEHAYVYGESGWTLDDTQWQVVQDEYILVGTVAYEKLAIYNGKTIVISKMGDVLPYTTSDAAYSRVDNDFYQLRKKMYILPNGTQVYTGDYEVIEKLAYNGLLFIANEASTVQLAQIGTPATYTTYDLQTSTDGKTWTAYTVGDTISIEAGGRLWWKGNNTSIGESNSIYKYFVMTGNITAIGFVNSLINEDPTTVTSLPNYCFVNLFYNCTALKTIPTLTATSLGTSSLQNMFAQSGVNNITEDLIVSPTSVTTSSMQYMFQSCASLTDVAFTLTMDLTGTYCVAHMFYKCNALVDLSHVIFTGKPNGNYCMSYVGGNCAKLQYGIQMNYQGTTAKCANPWMYLNTSTLKWIKYLAYAADSDTTWQWTSTSVSNGVFVALLGASVSSYRRVPSGWSTIYYSASTGKYYKTNSTSGVECDMYGNVL